MNTNLKLARERFTNMSQKDVASALRISESAYQKYEQGQRELRGETLVKLVKILGVSTDTILGTEYSALSKEDNFFTDDERHLIDDYRTLDDSDKAIVVRIISALRK